LTDPDLSEARVTRRVAKGGHFVDRRTIEDNFTGNLEMLNVNFRFIDHLTIVNTTELDHIILAGLNAGKVTFAVPNADLPHWFTHYMPDIVALIV
jgi:predicted ABC-type ATPase